jgi:alkylglycerol monooxygenase
MKQLLIALSMPIFLFFVFVELWLAKRRRVSVYRFSDAITDLSCGVVSQISVFYCGKTLQDTYAHLYDNYRIVTLSNSWLVWVLGFFLLDFLFYWFHRLSHEVNFLWAVHIVHHQSEDYNLAAGLRQAILTSFVTWFFYLPMAFLGFPPLMYGVLHALNLIYQYWLHTEMIRDIGPLEKIINTPSHHRVHHGQNPQYIDKNYGGTLMCWDYLFGTFEKEGEPVVYGITKPLNSYNNLWAQFHYFVEIFNEAKAAPKWSDKIKVWFKGPAWSPEGLPVKVLPQGISRETFVKYDPKTPSGVSVYVVVTTLVSATAILFYLMSAGRSLASGPAVLLVCTILLSMASIGAFLDKKPWALRIELFRLGFIVGVGVGLFWGTTSFFPAALLLMAFTTLHLLWLRRSVTE